MTTTNTQPTTETNTHEYKLPDAARDRLAESKLESEEDAGTEAHEAGASAGRAWAETMADYASLERLYEVSQESGVSTDDAMLATMNEIAEEVGWDQILSDEEYNKYTHPTGQCVHFILGFAKGAVDVYVAFENAG